MNAKARVELNVLKANLNAGTCVGKPATEEQQNIRRKRIAQIEGA